MPVIRRQIFTERTLHVYLKKKFGHLNRSAKELLNLKFIGDWLLNKHDDVLLTNVICNDLMLCGRAVYFRLPAVRRAFLRALKSANYDLLGELELITFMIQGGRSSRYRRSGIPAEFGQLFLYLGDKKTHELLGAKELVLALSEYIIPPHNLPGVPGEICHGVGRFSVPFLVAILKHYAMKTSSSSVVNLLSKICQLGLVNLMQFVIEYGLPKVDGLYAKAILLWQDNARKCQTLLRSMVFSGVPIDRCQKMYLLFTPHNAYDSTSLSRQIYSCKTRPHIKTINHLDMHVASWRHSIKLLKTLHDLHRYSLSSFTATPSDGDAVLWKTHNDFILSAALYHPKDVASRQILEELPTIQFFKELKDRGWKLTRQILRNAIRFDCLPLVKYLLCSNGLYKEHLVTAIMENSFRCARYFLSLSSFKSFKMLHDVEVALVNFNVPTSMSVLLHETKMLLGNPILRPNHLTREFGTLMKSGNVTKHCIICFENINDLNVFVLPCGHSFHNTCIARCTKSQCPTCRVNYEREYVN